MKRLFLMLLVTSVVGVAGCAHSYKAAEETFNKADKAAGEANKSKEPFRRPVLSLVKGYWVPTEAVPETKAMRLPPEFKQRIRLKTVALPLSTIMSNEVARFGFNSVYSENITKTSPVTVDYTGDLQGLLSAIGSATGYRWELRDRDIYWSDVETRTFAIPMTPGSRSYASTVGGALTSSISGTTSSGSGTTTTSTGGGSGTSSQNSAIDAKFSLWKDLESQIKAMLSKKGTMFVSEATSTVTVTDYPDRLAGIESFIGTLKTELTRQVLVQVDVIEVTLTDKSAHGINWNTVSGKVGQYGFSLSINNAADVFPSGFTVPTLTATYRAGATDASTALVKALETQGRVSVKTHPQMVTLNNQLASLQIGTEFSYVAEASTTTTTSVGSTTAVKPGVARSGLMMQLLPRIEDKSHVVMQMALSISSIKQIRSITSGSSTVEVPEISTKNFQQVTRVKSGESMILAGFRQLTGDSSSAGLTREVPWLLGSQAAADGRTDTIVLITPYILGDKV